MKMVSPDNCKVLALVVNGEIITNTERSWKCTYEKCNKSFKVRSKLERHRITHTKSRPFKCPVPNCEKTYKRLDHLQIHAVVHGQDPKPFKCEVEGCESSFSIKHHLKRHKKEIHETERIYKECGSTFTQDYLLRKHMTIHTKKKPYPCEDEGCEKSFSSSTKLRMHKRVHFDQNRWRCAFQGCEQEFSKINELHTHIRNDHEAICELCNKKLKDMKALRRHMITHNPDRILFPCDWKDCEKHYYSKKAVYAHVRAVHQNDRRFDCHVPGCGMSFTYKKVMDNHIKNIHEHPRSRKIRKLNKDDKINRNVTEIEHLTGFGYYDS
ncbi:221_t:CDS:2, partial [Dentiscutata erythropus]